MDREILFRGENALNGQWEFGSLCKSGNSFIIIEGNSIKHKECILDVEYLTDTIEFELWNSVIPSTVCQYTKLNDNTMWEELPEKDKGLFLSEWNYEKGRKNTEENWQGKKIFESDICRFTVFDYDGSDKRYTGIVVYSGSRFMLWKSKDSEYYGYDGGFDLDWVLSQDDEFRVIGNIFDNPELSEK